MGAYAESEESAESGECVIFDASPDIMDDFSVEMPIETFGAVEASWNSLCNLCERMSSTIARVSTLSIT
jgi:hypothetical protein